MLPIREERPEGRNECKRLIEDQVVVCFGDRDHRGVPAHQLVHVRGRVLLDDGAELAANESDTALHGCELVSECNEGVFEEARVELPRPPIVRLFEGAASNVIDDVRVVAWLLGNEAEVA